MRKKILLTLFATILLIGACAQEDNTPPANGFSIGTAEQEFVNGIPTAPPRVVGGIAFQSSFILGNPTVGTLGSCSGTTNSQGLFKCPDRKAPGLWILEELNGPCFGQFIDVFTSPGMVAGALCKVNLRRNFLAVSPNQIDFYTMPSSLDITSEGMTNVYGMPVIQIVDPASSQVLASTDATAINGEGTWIGAPTNFLWSVYSGIYGLLVYNRTANGSLELMGGTDIQLYNNDPPACNPSQEELNACYNCCGVRSEWDWSSCSCIPY